MAAGDTNANTALKLTGYETKESRTRAIVFLLKKYRITQSLRTREATD
jgi:hypothetical protein